MSSIWGPSKGHEWKNLAYLRYANGTIAILVKEPWQPLISSYDFNEGFNIVLVKGGTVAENRNNIPCTWQFCW